MKKFYTLLIALLAIATGAEAQIKLQDPVISDTYIKFVGENTTNNYRFTLDTYEWEKQGPQFQITVEPLDATKAAQFTASDLTDNNYWEPMFRSYTKQLAGEEMTAQDNIKRVYIKNVAILANQFSDYHYLKVVGFEAKGDYAIPDGCFSGCDRIKSFDCNVQGTLMLGKNIVHGNPDFSLKVYTQQSADVWRTYKEGNGANFSIDDSYVYTANDPRIVSLALNLTVNGENRNVDLADEGGKINETDAIVGYVLNSYTAQTSGEVTELFMDYDVYPKGDGGKQRDWKQVQATNKGNGVWSFDGPAVNVLAGLESNAEYILQFSFSTNPGVGERAHYPTSGDHVQIKFTTGDISTGIGGVKVISVVNGSRFNLVGQRIAKNYKGIVIQNGKKQIAK